MTIFYLASGDAGRGDARRGDARRGDARHGDARRGDARRGDARRGDARRASLQKKLGEQDLRMDSIKERNNVISVRFWIEFFDLGGVMKSCSGRLTNSYQ